MAQALLIRLVCSFEALTREMSGVRDHWIDRGCDSYIQDAGDSRDGQVTAERP